MKKTCMLLLLSLIGIKCYAQHDPASFFQNLFIDLKEKNADSFINHYASQKQFELLVIAHIKAEKITRDSLDNATGSSDSLYESKVRERVFSKLIKQADSLQIDLANSKYIDCKYEEIKDPKILCVSLTGIIYFKSGDNFYEWIVNEAILIKGEWRIIDGGVLSNLNDHKFLLEVPDKVSAFGTTSKFKVKVTLAPPPALDTLKPPPPAPKHKKENK